LDRLYIYNHSSIDLHFVKNSDNFIVDEIPLYEFSGEGEHLILKISKKDITTWDALKVLSNSCGAKVREFGYAGLKDRDGFTIQYISIHKSYETKLENFSHKQIKIVEKTYHNNKIKIGHLKGNRFFIRFKKVSPTNGLKLKEVLNNISTYGIPNYFGYQRFGKNQDNYESGKAILQKKILEKNKKLKNFLISAYQSHIFNLWLSKRVEISKLCNSFSIEEIYQLLNYPKEIVKQIKNQKNIFKLLPGDRLSHYPHGKLFLCTNLEDESLRFFKKNITVTGPLPGSKVLKSDGLAGNLEKDFTKECEEFESNMTGARRFAWIFPDEIESKYIRDSAWFEFSFSLPKGSYATVLLEELLHKKLI
jgi:tRNA pseudouridine13 synthase